MSKFINDYNAFSFLGSEPSEKKTDYIKTKNLFITSDKKIKKDLEKVDKNTKHKAIEQKKYNGAKKIEFKDNSDNKKNDKNEDNMLERNLKIASKKKKTII